MSVHTITAVDAHEAAMFGSRRWNWDKQCGLREEGKPIPQLASLGVGWKRFWRDGSSRSSSKHSGIRFRAFGGKRSAFFGTIDFNGRCER